MGISPFEQLWKNANPEDCVIWKKTGYKSMTKFRSLVLLQLKDVNALPIESVTKISIRAKLCCKRFTQSSAYADKLSFPLTKRPRLCQALPCSRVLDSLPS